MGNLVQSTGDNQLISLIHGKNGGLSVPMPFERDIFLFDTYVAGTTHVDGIEDIEEHLSKGDKLNFFREPNNAFDNKAIVIRNIDGVKLGYVPRKDNVVFSRLMDAGKLLFGRIESKEWQGGWLKINIKIFLHE